MIIGVYYSLYIGTIVFMLQNIAVRDIKKNHVFTCSDRFRLTGRFCNVLFHYMTFPVHWQACMGYMVIGDLPLRNVASFSSPIQVFHLLNSRLYSSFPCGGN